MIDNEAMKEKLKIKDFINLIKYKINFNKENPNYFYPEGLTCFTGKQGSGKTYKAVCYTYKLLEKYPKSKLITNIQLKDYPIVTYEEYKKQNIELYKKYEEKHKEKTEEIFYEEYKKNNRVFEFLNNDDFLKYKNEKEGLIFLVDEIQLYMNSLESKNINLDVIKQLSQQRKQRIHIVCTSQVFGRMAKPLREQFDTVVLCRCILGTIIKALEIDRDSIEGDSTSLTVQGTVKNKYTCFLNPEYFKRYDTYYVIERNKSNFTSGEKQKDIYTDNPIEITTEKPKKKGAKDDEHRNINNHN